MTAEITVRNKIAQIRGNPVFVCGNFDCTVQFDFDREWTAYDTKTAVISSVRGGHPQVTEIAFSGDTVTLPVLRDVTEICISVTAGTICTAAPARIPCVRCVTDLPAEEYDPPRDVLAELLAMLAQKEPEGKLILTLENSALLTVDNALILCREGA